MLFKLVLTEQATQIMLRRINLLLLLLQRSLCSTNYQEIFLDMRIKQDQYSSIHAYEIQQSQAQIQELLKQILKTS